MGHRLIKKAELEHTGYSVDFQGALFGATNLSFLLIDLPPGEGPRLHRHDYDEVIVILEGCGTYLVDGTMVRAETGDVLLIPAGTAHGFNNTGDVALKAIDIHLNPQFATVWLED